MLLNLVYRMLGKILVDFGDDPLLHVGMERMPQICEGAGRCDDHECLHLALAHETLHRRGDPLSEAMFLEIVPVGVFNAAAQIRAGALESASRAVATLLVSWWVIIDDDTLGLEIEKLLVAGVPQE